MTAVDTEAIRPLDWEVPCERITRVHSRTGDGPAAVCGGAGRAEWVLTLRCCGTRVLYCTACTAVVMAHPVLHCAPCGVSSSPGSTAYRFVEPFHQP